MATARRQRHSAPSRRLHALGRNGPHLGVQVEFIERGPFRLARAHRHQNNEFEGERGDALLGSQPSHEGRDIFVGQGGVMLGGKRSRMAWAGFRQGGALPGCRPSRNRRAFADDRTRSKRPQTRLAVCVLVAQIGSITLSTRSVVTSATGTSPRMGYA